jgi:hypothetical protein
MAGDAVTAKCQLASIILSPLSRVYFWMIFLPSGFS